MGRRWWARGANEIEKRKWPTLGTRLFPSFCATRRRTRRPDQAVGFPVGAERAAPSPRPAHRGEAEGSRAPPCAPESLGTTSARVVRGPMRMREDCLTFTASARPGSSAWGTSCFDRPSPPASPSTTRAHDEAVGHAVARLLPSAVGQTAAFLGGTLSENRWFSRLGWDSSPSRSGSPRSTGWRMSGLLRSFFSRRCPGDSRASCGA